jgi:GT2 family glycosyltransferase
LKTAGNDPRCSVVVLTHDRAPELAHTVRQLANLPERPPIVVVDNASPPGSVEAVLRAFDGVELLRCVRNRGAAGRNEGVARVRTPYVAFCDDDTWWAPGALARAADLLDAHPRLGVVAARVLVGTAQRLDPTCDYMAASPLDAAGLPGPALISFMAGAAVMRTVAYRAAGGYAPRLFIRGEESLLGLDLASAGWQMLYAADVVTHHHPSLRGRSGERRVLLARNRIWIAWLRLSPASAWHETRAALHEARTQACAGKVVLRLLAGLPWLLTQRRRVSSQVEAMYSRVHGRATAPSLDASRRPPRALR